VTSFQGLCARADCHTDVMSSHLHDSLWQLDGYNIKRNVIKGPLLRGNGNSTG
jgi:hypothetical protein